MSVAILAEVLLVTIYGRMKLISKMKNSTTNLSFAVGFLIAQNK